MSEDTRSSANRQRYRVLELLGQGGFARVYRAEMMGDGGFSKEVALKFIKDGTPRQAEMLSRLRDEARVLGLLRHRAVVGVHELAHLDRGWAVVMEYIDGADCLRVAQAAMVPVPVLLEVVAEVASALDFAWHRSPADGRPLHLIHRDIKPANIFMTVDGQVKVLDFGAATAEFDLRESETRSIILGTQRYMPPERMTGQDGPFGDVYSLGVTFTELLLGVNATPDKVGTTGGRSFGEHLSSVVEGYLAEHASRLGVAERQDLVLLLREMMAINPTHRPHARDVEQRCRLLLKRIGGPDLRTWAPRSLPATIDRIRKGSARAQRQGVAPDELCGAVLREWSAASVPLPAPRPVEDAALAYAPSEPTHRGRLPLALGVAAGLLLVLGLGGGVLAWLAGHQAPPEPEAATPVPVDVAPVEEPREEPVVEEEPTPPRPRQRTARTPPAEPPPEPEPAEPPPGTTVRVVNPPAQLSLVASTGRFRAEQAPPGTYQAWARFAPGSEPVRAGTITIVAGRENVITCQASFKRCTGP